MAIMAPSPVAGHLDHETDIHRQSHGDEDNEHDPVASPHIWVGVWHVEIVGPQRQG
jgi:hypothetical protein